jgi:hypothetical protein
VIPVLGDVLAAADVAAVEFCHRVPRPVGPDPAVWPPFIFNALATAEHEWRRRNGEAIGEVIAIANACVLVGSAWWVMRRIHFFPAARPSKPAVDSPPAFQPPAPPSCSRAGCGD